MTRYDLNGAGRSGPGFSLISSLCCIEILFVTDKLLWWIFWAPYAWTWLSSDALTRPYSFLSRCGSKAADFSWAYCSNLWTFSTLLAIPPSHFLNSLQSLPSTSFNLVQLRSVSVFSFFIRFIVKLTWMPFYINSHMSCLSYPSSCSDPDLHHGSTLSSPSLNHVILCVFQAQCALLQSFQTLHTTKRCFVAAIG